MNISSDQIAELSRVYWVIKMTEIYFGKKFETFEEYKEWRIKQGGWNDTIFNRRSPKS